MKKFINLTEEIYKDINLFLVEQRVSPLPDLFKHMVLAIFRKGPRTIGWFQSSVMIAFESLLQNGFITGDSNLQSIRLTSKGQQQNRMHASEPKAKSDQFDRYFDRFV